MANTNQSQMQKLHKAQKLIEEVQYNLNTTESECSHCGLNRAENWMELKDAKELGTIINKLVRLKRKGGY